MKYLSLRIVFVCVFLPFLCYILTIQTLEKYLQGREFFALRRVMVQNYRALHEGQYTIEEEVNRNIGDYLAKSSRFALGIRMQVLVKTKDDRIIYPTRLKRDLSDANRESEFSQLPAESLNYMDVAAENYRLLNDGLDLSLDLRIKHNSWLSNSLILLYLFLSLMVLQRFVRKGIRQSETDQKEREELIGRLADELSLAEARLEEVNERDASYQERLTELTKDKGTLSKDIDGLLEEMERLEAGFEEQKKVREIREREVLGLKEDLEQLRSKVEKPRQRRKKADSTGKRFKVLYKNLAFTDRAIDGFLSLTDEFQLKAEEVIHKLNENEALVSVRRKVFGKGGKTGILEADFSYSGRIYFQKDTQGKTMVITIGTKNTQEKDLAFIESVR